MKVLLFSFLLLFFSTFSYAKEEKQAWQIKYDSCHTYVLENTTLNPINALHYAQLEIEIGEIIKNKSFVVTGYIDVARILFILYRFPVALEYAHKALLLSQELSDTDKQAEAKRLCGAIHTSLEDIYNGRKYLNEAISYYENKKDTACLVRSLGTLAISMGRNGQYDECIRILNKIYKMSECQKNYGMMLVTLMNLSNAYWGNTNKPEKSMQVLKSIRFIIPPEEIEARDSICIQSMMGKYLFASGRSTEAKELLAKTIRQARLYKEYEIIFSTLGTLIEIAKGEKNFKASVEYYEEFLHLQDSIKGNDIKEKIEEAEAIYELAEKNAAIEHLILQGKWNKQRLILILFIIIIVSIIVLVKMKANVKLSVSKVRLLNEELKNRKSELTNMAIYYYELRKMIVNLYVKLRQINYKCKNKETNQALIEICTLIAKNSTLDETKDKINNYIDTNYSNYISKLDEKFPELTDSEKRICTMLLIDYTTKEISTVLNITEKSINNIRSKIRRKMDIPESSSISQFLKSI